MEHTDKFYKLIYKDGFVETYGQKFTYEETIKQGRKKVTNKYDVFARENLVENVIELTDGLTGLYLGSVDMNHTNGMKEEEVLKYIGLIFSSNGEFIRKKREMSFERYGVSPLYNNDKEES